MTFKFKWLCELLDKLDQCLPQQRATFARQDRPGERIVTTWFKKHVDHLSRTGHSAIALLSALFPEYRPDRSYCLKQQRLTHIFGRALGISAGRQHTLRAWQTNDGKDFATCVEYVMGQAENPKPLSIHEVTLEEIDHALDEIASKSPGSSPALRSKCSGREPFDILAPIIRRLQSYEAKWLVRMMMKSYHPVEVPEYVALHTFHFLLPKLLLVQSNFAVAITTLSKAAVRSMPFNPMREHELRLLPHAMAEVEPSLGTMIKRQPYDKARSLKHCCNMAVSRTMSIERKYDGEYCQIHIDISKGRNCIQIFSKSSKDSTLDRTVLHDAIKTGLQLGKDACCVRSRCILEGELVVWSRSQRRILPFYHIRKHVLHGGRRIGNNVDSPKKADENTMIVFYDVLMLDDRILISEPHKKRRAILKAIIRPVEGSSHLVERTQIDFSRRGALQKLRKAFAKAIALRWEGFVLKGIDDPYFTWNDCKRGIKLKKDYIAGLGESADLCIVACRRDPEAELSMGIGPLRWTYFYIACLLNKADVQRHDAKPLFRVIDSLGPQSMSKDDLLALNTQGQHSSKPFELDSPQLHLEHRRTELGMPHHVFTHPIVVEVMGAGFERAQNTNYWILRFPRTIKTHTKLHFDREVAETTSFDELQTMAEQCMHESPETCSQEDIIWMKRLLSADPKSKYKDQCSPSTCTSTGRTPPSTMTASVSPVNERFRRSKSTPPIIRPDSPVLNSFTPITPGSVATENIFDNKSGGLERKRRISAVCTSLCLTPTKRVKASSQPVISPNCKRSVFAENANTVTVNATTHSRHNPRTARSTNKKEAISHPQRPSANTSSPQPQVINVTVTKSTAKVQHFCSGMDENEQQQAIPLAPTVHSAKSNMSSPSRSTENQLPEVPQQNNIQSTLAAPDTSSWPTISQINADPFPPPPPHPFEDSTDTTTPDLTTTAPQPQTQPQPDPPFAKAAELETSTSPTQPKRLHIYMTPSSQAHPALQPLAAGHSLSLTANQTTFARLLKHIDTMQATYPIIIIASRTSDSAYNGSEDIRALTREMASLGAHDQDARRTIINVPVFDVAILDGGHLNLLLDVICGRAEVSTIEEWFCAVMEFADNGRDGVVATAKYEEEILRDVLRAKEGEEGGADAWLGN